MIALDFNKELSAFSDWLETNTLDSSAQALWLHLMIIANKSRCPEWFTVANSLLQAKVGVSENTLIKHRNILQQRGRIDYRSQGKQKAGKYRMIPFTSEITAISEVNLEVKREVKHAVNHEVKGSALFKDLSSFKDLTTTTTTTQDGPQSMTEAYATVFGGGTPSGLFIKFLLPLMEKYGEQYAIELIMESGESGNKPSLRHMQSINERWEREGIRSRSEAKQFNLVTVGGGHNRIQEGARRGNGPGTANHRDKGAGGALSVSDDELDGLITGTGVSGLQ